LNYKKNRAYEILIEPAYLIVPDHPKKSYPLKVKPGKQFLKEPANDSFGQEVNTPQ